MRIHEAGKNDSAGAIDLYDLLTILFQPGIAQGVLGGADRDDLPAKAKDSGGFDDAEFLEVGTAARAKFAAGKLEREQLANVGQQQRRLYRLAYFSG